MSSSKMKRSGDEVSTSQPVKKVPETCVICNNKYMDIIKHIMQIHPLAFGLEKDGVSGEQHNDVVIGKDLLKEARELGLPLQNVEQSLTHFLVWNIGRVRLYYHIITAGSMRADSLNDKRSVKWRHREDNYSYGHVIADYLFKYSYEARKNGTDDRNMCLMNATLNSGSYASLENILPHLSKRWTQVHDVVLVLYDEGTMPNLESVPTHFARVIILRRKGSFDRVISAVFKNEALRNHCLAHMVSVNDVVQLTGIQLFKSELRLIDCLQTARNEWEWYNVGGRFPELFCRFCQISFGTVELMGNHFDSHPELKFRCIVCRHGFVKTTNLRRHEKSHSDNQKAAARIRNRSGFVPLVPLPPDISTTSKAVTIHDLAKEIDSLRKEINGLRKENEELRIKNTELAEKCVNQAEYITTLENKQREQ